MGLAYQLVDEITSLVCEMKPQDIAFLGDQVLYINKKSALKILKRHSVDNLDDVDFGVSHRPEFARRGFISTKSFFSQLGVKKLAFIDLNEFGDVQLDLNRNIPPQFSNHTSFLINVGTIEHIMDIYTGLKNCARLVTVNGALLMVVPKRIYPSHGFFDINPTLLYDFYGEHGFSLINEKYLCYIGNPSNAFFFSMPVKSSFFSRLLYGYGFSGMPWSYLHLSLWKKDRCVDTYNPVIQGRYLNMLKNR
jgi:hypothetical protein